ncbi:MAG: hypothetical protein ABH844_04120 [Candidatus Omnitrophota bacterium]
MMKRIISFVAVLTVLSSIMASGCAFGTRRPKLEYSAITPVCSQKDVRIRVEKISDVRPDKDVIGNVRNGFGMKTADVVTTTDIADWVTNALKLELNNAGYKVTVKESDNEISGEIVRVFCTANFNYEGEVIVSIILKVGSKVVINKTYSGKATALNWAATSKSYGTTLQRSLQQVMKQIVGDVERSL